MSKFVLITLFFSDGKPKILDLQPYVAMASSDWIRFSPYCWIVWTEKRTDEIADILRVALASNDQVIVAPIDFSGTTAYLAPWIWGWMITKDRSISSMLVDDGVSALAQFREKSASLLPHSR